MSTKPFKKKIGILTFHCADNFGAMLQAYGLLTWLSKENFEAYIINYVPPFLKGREWFFPYIPDKSFIKRVDFFLWGTKQNIGSGSNWWKRKNVMNQFRKTYLTKNNPKIFFDSSLFKVKVDILIVGSDQIWNPNITFGFRAAYFGAFSNNYIQKVIAYGASFGSNTLSQEKEQEFSKFLSFVDDISMREKEAAKYVENNFDRKATYVLDPVFLLDRSEWKILEDYPEENNYIFYYETEYCPPLREAAHRLAKKKGLKVIGVSLDQRNWKFYPFKTVWAIGPSQFLGYISKATYVFTNSFHGLAFSILFHKPFYVWNHSTVGARIETLLNTTHLTQRMAPHPCFLGDENINWEEVDGWLNVYKKQSMEFLRKSLVKSLSQ